MLKIDKTIYQNLQSHIETCLNLSPGFNVVTGTSESGKTAMLRGDRLLVENKPLGTAWVRKDKNDEPVGTLVVTHFYNNGYQVSRVRGKSVNRYVIVKPDGTEQTLEGFADKVPEEVLTVTGIRPAVFFDDGKDKKFAPVLNFAFQMDAPFLLSETGSLCAKVFGKMAGSELVDAALDDLNKDIHDAQRRKRTAEDEVKQKDLLLQQYEGLDRVRALFDRSEIIFKTVLADVARFNLLETLAADLGKVDAEVIRVKGALDALAGLQRGEMTLAGVSFGWVRYSVLDDLAARYTDAVSGLWYVGGQLDRLKGLSTLENALAGIKANQERGARLEELAEGYRVADAGLYLCRHRLFMLDRLPEDEAFLQRTREKATRLDLLTGLSTEYTGNRDNLERVDKGLQHVSEAWVADIVFKAVVGAQGRLSGLFDLVIDYAGLFSQLTTVRDALDVLGDPKKAGEVLIGTTDAQKRLSWFTELDRYSKTIVSQLTTVREALDVLGDPVKAGGILQQVAADKEKLDRLTILRRKFLLQQDETDEVVFGIGQAGTEVQAAKADYWQILKDAGVCPTCGQKVEGGLNCGH